MDDARLPAMADGADHHAERGGRLALALAGVDDQKAFFLRLGRHDPVMGGLCLLHLFGMLFGRALDHCGASLSWERSMAALFDRGFQRARSGDRKRKRIKSSQSCAFSM